MCYMNDVVGVYFGVGYNVIVCGKMVVYEFRKGNCGGFISIKKIKDVVEVLYVDLMLLME